MAIHAFAQRPLDRFVPRDDSGRLDDSGGRDESEGARRQRGARRRRGAMTTYLGHCEAEGRGNPWLSPMSRLCQKGAWASAHGRVGSGRAEGLAFEGGELVAQPCGLLEFEVAGVFEHCFFKPFDLTHQILLT